MAKARAWRSASLLSLKLDAGHGATSVALDLLATRGAAKAEVQ